MTYSQPPVPPVAPLPVPARAVPPQQPPMPVVRLQAPEEPPMPSPLLVPPPEQLGIATAAATPTIAGIDWSAAHARLDRLGATCFEVDKLPDGACRVTCLVPSSQPNLSQRFEVRARTADEAVRRMLEEAEKWAAR